MEESEKRRSHEREEDRQGVEPGSKELRFRARPVREGVSRGRGRGYPVRAGPGRGGA